MVGSISTLRCGYTPTTIAEDKPVELMFGPYRGKLLAEVPLHYLTTLFEEIADDFDLLLDIAFELQWRELNERFVKRVRRRRRKT